MAERDHYAKLAEQEQTHAAHMAVLVLQHERSLDQRPYVRIEELFCEPSEVHQRLQQGTVGLCVELRESWSH
jgi:hypothetical protein